MNNIEYTTHKVKRESIKRIDPVDDEESTISEVIDTVNETQTQHPTKGKIFDRRA